MKNICFSIMPFAEDFKDIDQIIAESAQECGLEYVRSDERCESGDIMGQVIHDIHRAAVVVADITGHNPNVFYELGIAHQIKGSESVVIITREASPFDVHKYRQITYRHTQAGRAALKESLPKFLAAAVKTQSDREVRNDPLRIVQQIRVFDLTAWAPEAGKKSIVVVHDCIHMEGGTGSEVVNFDYGCSGNVSVQCEALHSGTMYGSPGGGWPSVVDFDVPLSACRQPRSNSALLRSQARFEDSFYEPDKRFFQHRPLVIRDGDRKREIDSLEVILIFVFPAGTALTKVEGYEFLATELFVPGRSPLCKTQPSSFGSAIVWSISRPERGTKYRIQWDV